MHRCTVMCTLWAQKPCGWSNTHIQSYSHTYIRIYSKIVCICLRRFYAHIPIVIRIECTSFVTHALTYVCACAHILTQNKRIHIWPWARKRTMAFYIRTHMRHRERECVCMHTHTNKLPHIRSHHSHIRSWTQTRTTSFYTSFCTTSSMQVCISACVCAFVSLNQIVCSHELWHHVFDAGVYICMCICVCFNE